MALYKWNIKISGMWDWFQPETIWTTWQILKKTVTGYNWWDNVIASDFDIKDLLDSTGLRNTWSWKQDALSSQTAYTNKWTATKVPQISTNSLWQVTWITEVSITHPSQVSDTAYAASWDGVTTTAPSKNAVYDKISTMDTTIENLSQAVSSGGSFGGFINACKATGTQHTRTYTNSSAALNDKYVFRWKWWIWIKSFHWASATSSLSINWVTVLSEQTGSGTYTVKYNIWPFTMSEWDYAVFYTGSTWSSATMVATVYDYYDWETLVTQPWIYYNSSLWLISLSRNWTTWVTMADRNLWATTNNVSLSGSFWKYYQFGNNYWFSSGPSTSSAQADLSAYWPGNYYSSSSYFITSSADPAKMKDNSWNADLWWYETYYRTWDITALRWPCPDWYHIPNSSEEGIVETFMAENWLDTKEWLQTYLKIPMAWMLSYNAWVLVENWDAWAFGCAHRWVGEDNRWSVYWRLQDY